MGLAAPSLVEASRGLPSVKADGPSADDDLVTSVAISPPAIDEPVSPELALVDPELGARLRALMPVPDIELEPPPANVRVLHLTPPLAEEPLPEAAAAGPAAVPVAASRGGSFQRLVAAFLAGAAVASFVVVGVIAELGESEAPLSSSLVPVPPVVSPPPDAGKQQAAPGPTPGAKKPAAPSSESGAKSTQAPKPNAASRAKTAKQASAAGEAKTTEKQASAARQAKTTAKPAKSKAPGPAAEPRRFAWAPVPGALSYRVELFRGDEQVLRATTKDPTFELGPQWRHGGRVERLTPGSYRWYVWPVLRSGAAAKAVVQARLNVD